MKKKNLQAITVKLLIRMIYFEINRKLIFIFFLLFHFVLVKAQKDTAVKPTVTIISSFKPVLISPAKINFYGSSLPADTIREVREYNIPSQNYVYSYESVALNPLTMQTDSNELLRKQHHFLKIGYGNLNTPLLNAGVFVNSIPSAILSANVYAVSSKGNIKNQDYSLFSFRSDGSYFLKNNEAHANITFDRRQFYLFGYDHTKYDFLKKDISHLFNDFNFSFGVRNLSKNYLKLNYHPTVGVDLFSTKDSLTETSVNIQMPLEFRFSEMINSGVNFSLDATKVSFTNQQSNKVNFKNNVANFNAFIAYKSKGFYVNAGAALVRNMNNWEILPDIKAELPMTSQNVILFAGWNGRVIKNTYRNLSMINPYLKVQSANQNTVKNEISGGVKSFIGKFISVSAKATWERFRNYQFFLNDTASGSRLNAYVLSDEAHLNNFSLHGELSYVKRDKFSFSGEVTFNGYTGMKKNAKAWNTLPMEARINFMSQVNKKIKLTGSFYLFAGGQYLEIGNISKVNTGGSDLSVASEYRINRKFIGFLNVNNIFGNSYERWRYYPVYGLNAVGGVKVIF